MTKLRLLARLITVCVIGNMFLLADAQTTSTRHLCVKEIVKTPTPVSKENLRFIPSVQKTDKYLKSELYYDASISYLDIDNQSSTIDKVLIDHNLDNINDIFDAYTRYEFWLPVRTINDYTIYLAGDDGKIGRGLGTTHVIAGANECDRNENRYIARDDIVKDLLTFAKSPQNNAFPVKEVEMVIYPWTNKLLGFIGFTMDIPDVTRIQKTGQANTYYGVKVFGEGHVKTRNGDYRVTFHSTDGDPGMYEAVVIERNDGLRCKVDELSEVELVFDTDDGERDSAVIKLIGLEDPEIGYITIIDDIMYDSLMTLKDDTVNNHAITFSEKQKHEFVFIDETGIYFSEDF